MAPSERRDRLEHPIGAHDIVVAGAGDDLQFRPGDRCSDGSAHRHRDHLVGVAVGDVRYVLGAGLCFAVLAAAMVLTRKVDWYALQTAVGGDGGPKRPGSVIPPPPAPAAS